MLFRSDLGKDGKQKVSVDACAAEIGKALTAMQKDLLEKARTRMQGMVKDARTIKDVHDFFSGNGVGGLKIDYALVKNSAEFDKIAAEFSLTPRCLPFDDPGKVIVAKAY